MRKESKPSRRLDNYLRNSFTEVMHTTLNPEGPGVVRIHLVPPKYEDFMVRESVVILNGQDIIPINYSWAIVLNEFIKEVNKYHGREVSDEDIKLVLNNTCKGVRKVYPLLSKKLIKTDIYRIMNTFKQVAYGEEVTEDIGYMTMSDYAPYMRAPHRMDIMVSAMEKNNKWNCNQKCVHCYAAGQEHSNEEEMSTEQ